MPDDDANDIDSGDDRSTAREPSSWGFASPGPLRDKLTALAFGGGKVVTSGLLAEYEIDGDPVEQPGDISILVDSAELPVALIENVLAKVIRLADMSDQDAIDEGEGYADAAAFRVSHEDFWNRSIEEVREGLGDPGFTITDDTLIVAERFRIVGDPRRRRVADHPGRPARVPARSVGRRRLPGRAQRRRRRAAGRGRRCATASRADRGVRRRDRGRPDLGARPGRRWRC